MLDINVKTIDGQNRSYSVPDNYTVKQFKEKIATSLSIPVERQRLIFQGRELKDANSLQEFDVNGKTLHLVQRVPPSANQPQPQTTAQSQTNSSSSGANFGQGIGGGMPDVSQLIQHIIGGLGDLGQNATFNATTTGDANGMEVHIDLSNMSQIVNDNEIRSRIRNIRRFLSLAQSRLNRLEEIQSGAPLDDTTNSSIIVGSIHGTASLSDANGSLGTIGFDINHLPNLNMFPGLLNLNQPPNNRIPAQVPTPAPTPAQTPVPTPATTTTTTTTTASNPVTITTTNPTTPSSLDPAQIAASMHAAAAQAASLAAAQAHANALRATSSIHNITDDVTSHAAAVHAAAVQAAAAQAAHLHAATLASMQNQSTPVPEATTTTTTLNDPNTTTSTTTTTNTEPVNTSTTTTTTTTNTTNTPTVEAATPPTETEANNQSIGVEVLGEVIQSVMDSYSRFLPYLQHYHSMLVNDETEPTESPSSSSSSGASGASSNLNVINNNNTNIIVLGGGDNRRQRFCNNINDMMHLLGHLFHNLSDLHINIRDRPPRQMHTMNSMQHSASAIISAAVPIEANIQIPFPPSRPPVSSQNNSTTTTQTSNNTSNSNQIPLLQDRINQMYRQQRNRIQSEPSSSAPSQPQSSNESISSDEPTEATDMPMPLPFTLDSNNQETPTPNPIQQPQQQQQIGAPRGILRGAIRPQARLIPGFIPPPLTRLAGPTGQQIPFQMPTPLHTHLHSAMNSYDQYLPCNSVHFYNTTNPISSMANNPNLSQFPISAGGRGRGRVPMQDSQSAASNSQRRRHPAGDQPPIASTQPPPPPPPQQQQQQQPNMFMPGINQILGMLTNSLNRPASATVTSTTTTNGTGLNDNQNIRVNIGGIPGQISIATLTPNGELQSNLGGNNLGNIIEQLVQGITGGGGAPAGIANILAGSGGVGGIIPPQQRRVAPGAATVPPGGVPNESGNQMVNALMREAISLMDSNNTNDQRLNQPLREFLRLFGEDEDEESSVPNAAEQNATAARSTLSIFNTLFSSMTLGDMINLARGQDTNQVFERSRLPLQAHIRNYFKNNNSTQQQGDAQQQFELTEDNLIFLSDRLYNDIFIDENGLHIDLNQFVALLNDPSVDFAKSFEKLMKHHLKIMLKHVFDSKFDLAENAPPLPPDSTWSAILFKNFNNLVGDLVRQCRFCLRNADSHFTLIVTQKLREAVISQNISNNSMFFSIFENFIRTQIQQTLDGISMSNSIDQQFIVHITEPTLTAASSSQLNNSDNHDSKSTDSSKSYETVSSTLSSNNFMDIDQQQQQQQNVIKKSETTQKTNLAPSSSSTTAQSNKQTSNWKNILPSEWETIIERDIQTQQNQSNIRPFSDAYCSGLPAKRRRIISSKNDLLNVNLFKKVLNRTLEKVQLKPNVSHEQLIEESVDQSQLLDSFSVEFDSVINDRLRNDPDFNTIIKSQNDKHKDSNSKEEEKEEERFLHSKKRL